MAENTVTLYGIANCDTMKKTRKLLDAQGIHYLFHDYKKAGLDEELAQTLLSAIALEQLINKRGTTWRKLPASTQESLNGETARALVMNHPSLLRRPIIRHPQGWLVGYDESKIKALAN